MFVVFKYPRSSADNRAEGTLGSLSAPHGFADGTMASKSTSCGAERKSADLCGRAAPVRENRLRQVRLEVMQVQQTEYLLRYVKLDPLFVFILPFRAFCDTPFWTPFCDNTRMPSGSSTLRKGEERKPYHVFQGTLQC